MILVSHLYTPLLPPYKVIELHVFSLIGERKRPDIESQVFKLNLEAKSNETNDEALQFYKLYHI